MSDETRVLNGLPVQCDEIVPEGVIFLHPETWAKLDARLHSKPAQEPAEHTHKQVYTIAEGWHCGSCGAKLLCCGAQLL